MRRAAFAFALSLLAAPLGAAAQSSEDAAGIEATIRAQVEAMQADDWGRAFTYASPMIQSIFQSPEGFAQMVTNGYPMVWKPRSYRSGPLAETPQGLRQTMVFEDSQGKLYVADYFMIQVDGAWRINGVQIRPAPAESA